MPSSTAVAAAPKPPSVAAAKPPSVAAFKPSSVATTAGKPSSIVAPKPSSAAADSEPSSAAAVAATRPLSAMSVAAATLPTLPPGFEEYILAQRTQIAAPVDFVAKVGGGTPSVPNPSSIQLNDDKGEDSAEDGIGDGLKANVPPSSSDFTKSGGVPTLLRSSQARTNGFCNRAVKPSQADDRAACQNQLDPPNRASNLSRFVKLRRAIIRANLCLSLFPVDAHELLCDNRWVALRRRKKYVLSTSKRRRGDENSSHEDDSTELN